MFLLHGLLGAYLLLFGGLWIKFAIRDFKAEKYFAFGVDMMCLVYVVLVVIKCYFSI
jgi:hypothetical protein